MIKQGLGDGKKIMGLRRNLVYGNPDVVDDLGTGVFIAEFLPLAAFVHGFAQGAEGGAIPDFLERLIPDRTEMPFKPCIAAGRDLAVIIHFQPAEGIEASHAAGRGWIGFIRLM